LPACGWRWWRQWCCRARPRPSWDALRPAACAPCRCSLVAVLLADAWPNPSGAGNSPRRSPAERRSHAACAR